MQACMGLALALSVVSTRDRTECESIADEEGLSKQECDGMEAGDFVSVTIYILQLFTPLNFLGTVYNALVMAFVDLGNLAFPLGTAGTGVTTRHLALGDSHLL